jgi:hypothetical protein
VCIPESVTLAYASTNGLIDVLRMTHPSLFTVGSVKPFKGFTGSFPFWLRAVQQRKMAAVIL